MEVTHDRFGESFNAFVVAVLPGIGDACNIITYIYIYVINDSRQNGEML